MDGVDAGIRLSGDPKKSITLHHPLSMSLAKILPGYRKPERGGGGRYF